MEAAVRVVVRVRPLLDRELVSHSNNCCRVEEGKQLIIGEDRAYTFDTVLDWNTTQQRAYDECCAHLLGPFFEGYNCTVFAYGQTGAGKTHTMDGLVQFLLSDMFRRVDALSENNIGVTVRVSCMEIHNEVLRDLLYDEARDGEPKPITVRDGVDGNAVVLGLVEHTVRNQEELQAMIHRGTASRTVASTLMNDASSRSHSITTVTLEQHVASDAQVTSESVVSKFRLVDLAGSERVKRTGASGARLKESININSGLLILGNVIAALCEQQENPTKKIHVPYRECKLTRVLQDSLGGNSVTVMVACVSPADSNLEESLNTLKYANRAKNIMNKPIKNKDPHAMAMEKLQGQLMQAVALLTQHNIPFDGHGLDVPVVNTGSLSASASAATAAAVVTERQQSKAALAESERERNHLLAALETVFELVEGFEVEMGGSAGDATSAEERDVEGLAQRIHRLLHTNRNSHQHAAHLQTELRKLERHTKQLEDDLFRAEYSAMSAQNERQKLLDDIQQGTVSMLQSANADNETVAVVESLARERDTLWKEKLDIESRKEALEAECAQYERVAQEKDQSLATLEDTIREHEDMIQQMLNRDAEARRALEQYTRLIERTTEQRDKANAELAKAMHALEQRGLGKDMKEREMRRVQATYQAKLRTVENSLTELRRKQRESEARMKQHNQDKDRVRRLQAELISMKDQHKHAKERAKQEAIKSDKIRAAAQAQLTQMQRQLKELENEKTKLAGALAKKDEEIQKVKNHSFTAPPQLHTSVITPRFQRSATATSVSPARPGVRPPHPPPPVSSDPASLEQYQRLSDLRSRIDTETHKVRKINDELDDAVRFRDDLHRTLAHRRSTDESRLQRSLSGWALKISKLEKEIAQLRCKADPSLDERIASLLSEKSNAETRRAEISTLMPTVENTLAEKVRCADDHVEVLSTSKAYHERQLATLMKELEELQKTAKQQHQDPTTMRLPTGEMPSSFVEQDVDHRLGVMKEQLEQKERAMRQMAQQIVEKNNVIESLQNMLMQQQPQR
eukprot:PhM_4_TR11704/c0_g1_i1/m.85961/K10395/KIF4_21_27; kinesin family member 4/21/27